MSKPENASASTPVTPIAQPVQEPATETQEKKQSFLSKTKHFVKSHKKPALAALGLVGLVGVAAVAGRNSAPTPDVFLAITPADYQEMRDADEAETKPESDDTNVA